MTWNRITAIPSFHATMNELLAYNKIPENSVVIIIIEESISTITAETENIDRSKVIHILTKFYNCINNKFLTDKDILRTSLVLSVNQIGLNYLSFTRYFHL